MSVAGEQGKAQRVCTLDEYRKIRDYVAHLQRHLQSAGGDRYQPSQYWSEEIAAFSYLFDANEGVLRRFRDHCYHITGAHPREYEDEDRRELFAVKKRALEARGGGLPFEFEHPAMGGFGYEIDGGLVNIDTLKFYEVLVAWKLAGILDALDTRAGRLHAVEIGSGWGGFARVFKRRYPQSTYYLVDLPEVLLFSGIYLKGLYPDARFLLVGHPDAPTPTPDLVGDYDFVLVPHLLFDELHLPAPDVFLNMVSFQEMTERQVRSYAARAVELGTRAVYSLNYDRGPYNRELNSVSAILEEFFEAEQIPVLAIPYTRHEPEIETDDASVRAALDAQPANKRSYRHFAAQRARVAPEGARGLVKALENREDAERRVRYAAVRDPLVPVWEGRAGTPAAVSDYWRLRQDRSAYLLEATPGMLAHWPHHLLNLNGPYRYLYRSHRERYAAEILNRLTRLLRLCPLERLYSFPDLPATIGFRLGGRVHTEDTLLLSELSQVSESWGLFESLGEERMVCEIGPSFGIGAHHLRRLIPGRTCVLVDYARFLPIAGYLLSELEPAACIAVAAEALPDKPCDFLLVPFERLDLLQRLPIGAALTLGGFFRLPGALVGDLASALAAAGCAAIAGTRATAHLDAGLAIEQRAALGRWYSLLNDVPLLHGERMVGCLVEGRAKGKKLSEKPALENAYFLALRKGFADTADF